eukprot:TRINITY_DN6020_c0_g4_i1.p1 TRINITY_DN6020_c0_g4~~TRINITY_DN6020_c0_g4_i1.p1  ORF type:complete len:676 (-),score=151.62 TRINITY_DN6020_c0_g4_i1:18-2045(-)
MNHGVEGSTSKETEKTEDNGVNESSVVKQDRETRIERPQSARGLGITLIVFINSKSGGQQGQIVYAKLARFLPNSYIFDLSHGGPAAGLNMWKDTIGWRILACGGDGTAGWVLSELDKITLGEGGMPPVGVLPLGTGNDLSRTLGWGGGYSGENLVPILEEIQHSEVILLDRWKIFVEPGIELIQEHQHVEKETSPKKAPAEIHDDLNPREFIMNNYFSIGADADIALSFHNLRNEHPTLFTHRIINKGWYGAISIKSMFRGPVPLMNCVQIWVDDKPVKISKKIVGILVLNLPFWAGGCTPWGNPFKNKNDEKMKDNLGKSGSADKIDMSSQNRRSTEFHFFSPDFRKDRRNSDEFSQNRSKNNSNNNNNHDNNTDNEHESPLSEGEKNSGFKPKWGGEKKKKVPKHFEIPSVSDKMIEVIGLKGVVHMGTIKSGISKGKRLAQGQKIRIVTTSPLPAQVDGEPWILSPSNVSVSHFSQSPMLRKKGAVILPYQKEKQTRAFSSSPPLNRGAPPNILTLRSMPSSPTFKKDEDNNHNDNHNQHHLFSPQYTSKSNSFETKTSPTLTTKSNVTLSPSRSPSSSLDSININVKQNSAHQCLECNLIFSNRDVYDAHIASEHPNWLKANPTTERSLPLLDEANNNTSTSTTTTTTTTTTLSPLDENHNTEKKIDQLD